MEKDVAQTWWSVVAASPPATIVAVAALVGVIWSIVNWAFRQRIEALQERLNLANDRLLKSNEDLERLRDQLQSSAASGRGGLPLSPAMIRAATPVPAPVRAPAAAPVPALAPDGAPLSAPALANLPAASAPMETPLPPNYAGEIARIIDANTATISVSAAARPAKPKAKKD